MTVDRSGSFRLASPPPACSCAPASVGSSRPSTATTILDFRFKKAASNGSALTASKKYTEYCAVTFPPKLMFISESRTAPEYTTSQNCGEKPREGYHPHLAVSSDCSHSPTAPEFHFRKYLMRTALDARATRLGSRFGHRPAALAGSQPPGLGIVPAAANAA